MGAADDIRRLVERAAPLRRGSGGWTRTNCRMCVSQGEARNDRRGRGGFMFNADCVSYNCFNCGFKAGWRPGRPVSRRFLQLLQAFGVDLREFYAVAKEVPPAAAWTPPALAFEKHPLPPGARAIRADDYDHVRYFHARGFRQLADFRDVCVSDHAGREMHRRIIIPMRDADRTVIGWYARLIDPERAGAPKYVTGRSPGAMYGLDHLAAGRRYIFVVEGVLDAKLLQGVALGGFGCAPRQAELLNASFTRKIAVPDSDRPGQRLLEAAAQYGWWVSPLPADWGKDACDAALKFGRHAVAEYLIRHRRRPGMPPRAVSSGFGGLFDRVG